MKTRLLAFSLLAFALQTTAQNVGIGHTDFTPSSSALLELRSTTSGLLIPRMTLAERDAIVSPEHGLLIYQTNLDVGFKYYDGSEWTTIADGLGDHEAIVNIKLNDNWLSNDGDDEGIRIGDNGYVGIGDDVPSYPLVVKSTGINSNAGGINNQHLMRIEHASSANNGGGVLIKGSRNMAVMSSFVDFSNYDSSHGDEYLMSRVGGVNESSGEKGAFAIYTNGGGSDDSGLAERMRVTSDGDVGIGVADPTRELDVNGDLRIRGLAGNGTVALVVDNDGNVATQVVSGGSDNLGDHSATTHLDMNNLRIDNAHTLGTKNLEDQTDNEVDVNDNLDVNGQVRFNSAFADGDVEMNNKHIRNTNTIHTKNIQDQTDNEVDVNDNLDVNGQVRFNSAFADGDVQMNNKHIRNTNTIHTKNIQDQTDNQVDVNDNLNVNGQVRFNTAFADGNVEMNNKQITNVNHIFTKKISDQTDGQVDVLDDFNMNAKDIRNIDVAYFNGNSGGIEYLGSNRLGLDYTIVPRSSSNMDLGRMAAGQNWDDVVANDFISFSDRRLKKEINALDYGLNEIMNIQTYSYKYINEAGAKTRMGVMAQEVLEVIPEAVVTSTVEIDDKGNATEVPTEYMGVSYDQFIPVLIKAVQEQQQQIEELKAQNQMLMSQMQK